MSSQPSRRDFLKMAGTSILATGIGPTFLRASDKSGSRPVVIGEGNWKFECHHDWGQVPDHIQWKNTHGVTFDEEGLIYIFHSGNAQAACDTVVVFTPEGKFVRSFGKEFAGGGHGIDIRKENGTEYLYLSVTAPHRVVVKCDKLGNVIWKQTAPEAAKIYDDKHLFNPTNVCFGTNGELYVGDGYGSHYMHQYDADGNWIRSWGGPGQQAGQLKTPHGQWLDNRNPERPLILVADRANFRLQFFTLNGEPVQILQGVNQASKHGEKSELTTADGKNIPVTNIYGISHPSGIDAQGEHLLIADLHARVSILNGKNELVANLGFSEDWTTQVLDKKNKMRTNPALWVPGKFVHPHDASFDRYGNIFVTEWVDKGRITFLRRVS